MSTIPNSHLIQTYLDAVSLMIFAFYESAGENLPGSHYAAVFDIIYDTFEILYDLDAPPCDGECESPGRLAICYLLTEGLAGSEHHGAHLKNIANAAVLNERLAAALYDTSSWIQTPSGSVAVNEDRRLGYVDFVIYAMRGYQYETAE